MYPIFFHKATQGVPAQYSARATAIVTATIYIGQFLAPLFQRLVGSLFHNPTARFLYLFVAVITVIGVILLLINMLLNKDRSPQFIGE
jgi:biotin transporter BioY